MPTITFVQPDGSRHIVDAPAGKTVMEVAVDNLMPGIAGDCGGNCSCATCHAYLAPEWTTKVIPMQEDEEMILEGALDVRPTSRLTCQITVGPDIHGLVVELPASPY